ncbi:MAG: caspase family protein, partial [Myxococcota bacterium]
TGWISTDARFEPDGMRPTLRLSHRSDSKTKSESVEVETDARGRLLVWVDRVPLDGPRGRPLTQQRTRLTIPVGQDSSEVEVVVADESGRQSLPVLFRTGNRPGVVTKDLYVAALGVSDYQRDALDLQYAAEDAKDIADAFEKHSDFANVHKRVLVDGQVSRAALESVREFFSQARVDDTLVLHVAGHGEVTNDGRYYFLTSDTDPDDLAKAGITFEQLESVFMGVRARRRLMLMDTCHAGDPADATAGVVAAGVSARAVSRVRRSGAPQRKRIAVMERFMDLRSTSGATVLAAASAGEFAEDSVTGGKNGVFTSAVLEALASTQTSGLTANALQARVADRVAALTGGGQRPVVRQRNPVLDFPLK